MALPWEDLKIRISKTRSKTPFFESHPDLPGANELNGLQVLISYPCINLTEHGIVRGNAFEYVACHKGPGLLDPMKPGNPYMSQWTGPWLVTRKARRLFDTKPLSKPIMTNRESDLWWPTLVLFHPQYEIFFKMHFYYSSAKSVLFVSVCNVLNHCGLVTPYGVVEIG